MTLAGLGIVTLDDTVTLAKGRITAKEIEKTATNLAIHNDLSGVHALALGRIAEAAEMADAAVFNLLNTLTNYGDQEYLRTSGLLHASTMEKLTTALSVLS